MIMPTFHHTLLFAACTSLLGGQIRDSSGQEPEPFVIKRDPVKTFTFGDGAQLQVFQIHENRIRIGRTTKPKDFKGHWSSNTYTVGSSANSLEETRFSLNGRIQGHHWEGQPSSLLFLCRILSPKKEAVVPKRFVWGHGSKDKPGWFPLGERSGIDAIQLPADEDLLKIHFEAKPTDNYRYHRDETIELVSGVISDDGKTIKTFPHDLKEQGLSELFVGIVPGEYPQVAWEMKFHWENPENAKAAKNALLLEEGRLLCFVNEDKFSSGNVDTERAGYDNRGDESSISRTYQWNGSPAKLVEGNSISYFKRFPKPGSMISLAVTRPQQPKRFSFVIPRPQ